MPTTYTPLATTTTVGGESTVTFSSISSAYTDLIIVSDVISGLTSNALSIRFNSDTGNNYSFTYSYSDGTNAVSGRIANNNFGYLGYFTTPGTQRGYNAIAQIQNYSNSTTFKTLLSRSNSVPGNTTYPGTEIVASLWSNTNAITSVTLGIGGTTFAAGSTFSLYGVATAAVVSGVKATGGDVVATDGTYWYHAFRSSGTFTPTQTLSCDILRISGGGGGGYNLSGGGGAGGIVLTSAQSLTASTSYTATVGAGGTGSTASGVIGGIGSQSNLTGTGLSLSTVFPGGGGKGDYGAAYASASTVASAGGATGAGSFAGGTTTTGQGNNGGRNGNLAYNAGGGGGAGAVGSNGSDSVAGVGGNGGAGINTYSSWASVTGTGVSGFYAGGGGGSGMRTSTGTGAVGGTGGSGGGGTGGFDNGTSGVNFALATTGVANTGGGGGGGAWDQYSVSHAYGAAGGSGLVIVRYAV